MEILSEQINEIIKKNYNNLKNDLDILFKESEEHIDISKELASARYYSHDSMRIKDNGQETSITLALELFLQDDVEIYKALENGVFSDQ